jgi:hypothetical protein
VALFVVKAGSSLSGDSPSLVTFNGLVHCVLVVKASSNTDPEKFRGHPIEI